MSSPSKNKDISSHSLIEATYKGNPNYEIVRSASDPTQAWLLDAENHTPLLGIKAEGGRVIIIVNVLVSGVSEQFKEVIDRLRQRFDVTIEERYLYIEKESEGLTAAEDSGKVFIPEEWLPKTIH